MSEKPKFNRQAIGDLMRYDSGVKSAIMAVANKIAQTARSSASAAEATTSRGEGYASAGFSTAWEQRSRRPRAIVKSNAPGDIAMEVNFETQKKNGISHLRAASKTKA